MSAPAANVGPQSAAPGVTPQTHLRMAAHFLHSLFSGQETGVVALFCKPSKLSLFAHLDRSDWYDDAAQTAMYAREEQNVYFAIGVQGSRPERGRGKEAGVIALPGLWADIDVLGPNHAAKNLPPTLEDAWSIVRAVPFPPTAVAYTGGGMQPYWLFKEPLETASDKDRRNAKRLTKAFQQFLATVAGRTGWTIDSTADLCRLLRLPGTWNRKQDTPVLVEYEVVDTGRRYNPSDFEEFLELEANPELKAHVQGEAPEKPSADFLRILAGCPWLQHCKDDAATLPEPEWYRMLSIVGRCRDGEQIAHELSLPYSRYSKEETDEKLKQAMGAAGPATCEFIANDLGQSRFCEPCRNRGKIKSPIVLGLPKRSKRADAGDVPRPARYAPDGRRLPNIQASDRQLREISQECLRALRAFNEPRSLFIRAGKIVVVTKEESGRHVVTDASDRIVRNRLTKAADFYEITEAGFRNCPPPLDVVKDILRHPDLQGN